MQTKIYGYIRVSSKDQNEDRQLESIKPYNIPVRQTYIDKQSGENIRQRQAEGIAIAKAKGVTWGKKPQRAGQ